jgi:hypothetical protein
MALRIHKFATIEEAQLFLRGGISGKDVTKGVYGLIGKTLTFTSPADNVTFTAHADTTRDGFLLTHKDIKTQIETAIPTLKVKQVCGRIAFEEATPSAGVALEDTATEAKNILGFDNNEASVGKVVAPTSAGPVPYFVGYESDGTFHVIITME